MDELRTPDIRSALRRNLAAAAVPYGFTILNVSAGGVLIRTHGPPTTGEALLFLCGAIAGFTAVGLLAGDPVVGGLPRPRIDGPWLGLSSGVAAIAGFGCATVIAHTLHGPVAFGAVSTTAIVVYLGVGALGAAVLEQRARHVSRGQLAMFTADGGRGHRDARRSSVRFD